MLAGSLSFPSMALAIDSGTVGGNEITNGTAANGEGSGGGTWVYDGADTISLDNFVGGAISTVGDTIIELEGNNTVEGSVRVENGDLTITGDDSAYGKDKPSLTLEGDDTVFVRTIEDGSDIAIKDANIYADVTHAGISASGNLDIINSGIYRVEGNESLFLESYKHSDDSADMTLQGSEIEATSVYSDDTMTIDNTNLNVIKPSDWAEKFASIIAIYKSEDYDYTWLEHAVAATKIILKGEENGTVVDAVDSNGEAYQYLTTGSDDKIELRASATPAYYGPTKGMPKTSDTTMPMVMGLGIVAACAAAFAAFSARNRKLEGKDVK